MIDTIEQSPLCPIVNPGSIAIFGASNKPTSMGTNQLLSLTALGFEGKIYPVHPKEKEVLGFKAYQSVLDLPEVPDLAVMILPTKAVPQVMAACGQKGIKHAIVVSGGFNEVGGQGKDLEEELKETAKRYGITFLGPNCLGVVNPHHKFNMTFLPFEGKPGFIGLASQSGSLVTQLFGYLDRFGIGFSTGISVGNEANIDIVDGLEYLAACPHTRVIGLYIETIRRGREFMEVARAIAPHKPIVAYYVGGSEAGKRAGFSHTGAMAGPDVLYDGVFRQSGIVRADSITEMFDFCWALGSCVKPAGKRVVIQTHSGGPGAAAADACGREGLVLADFSSETLKKLKPFVPHTGSVNNPVDLTFSRRQEEYFESIPEVLLEEAEADVLMLYCSTPRKAFERGMKAMGIEDAEIGPFVEEIIDKQISLLAGLKESHPKTFVGFSFRNESNRFVRNLSRQGIPVFPSPERAARAVSALVRYNKLMHKLGA